LKKDSSQQNPSVKQETGTTLSKNSEKQTQNQSQQKFTGSTTSSKLSMGGAVSSAVSNPTSASRQVASTSNSASTTRKEDSADEIIRQFQDPQLYQQTKEELRIESFQKRLQSAGIKINTLDGQTIGSKNGKIIVVDKGNKFQIFKSTSSQK